MSTTRKSCSNKSNNLRLGAALLLLVAVTAACADDRTLIDRTLEARTAALNSRDVEAYGKLIAPDYVKARPDYDPRAEMSRLFSRLQSLQYQVFRRDVQFESDGTARVIQQYQMVFTTPAGKTRQIKDVDHFLLKRYGNWPRVRWLIYQGLDQPPPPTSSPDADVPASPEGDSE